LWNPTAENMPRRELRTLQFDKLKVLVNRVYNESPYYKNKLTAAGVSPEHLVRRQTNGTDEHLI
jgi:phenylacetate-CoA ligase